MPISLRVATANSGLPVSYASDNPLVATIVGGMIHITGGGTAVITASQAGNSLWNPAPDVLRTLTVSLPNQTITFNALPAKIYGDADFTPGATASSGLTVSYSSNNPAVATIVGGMIHITGAGSAVITASQAGNTNFSAATDVTQPLTVNKAPQTITFNALPASTYGDIDFTPGATASSGLTVLYSSDNPAVATIVGGMLHITGTGSAVITASQAGNTNFSAATDVTQALTVNKANQTITFNALSVNTFGDVDFTPGATASSGLTVSYSSDNPAVATIVGGMIHITGAGSAVITASQTGNANYNAAADVTQTLTISKATQTITFNALPAKIYGDADFTTVATASSGLTVSYSSNNAAVATVTGGIIHITGAGTAVITASQAGSSNYNAAADIPQTLTVNKVTLMVTADNKNKTYGNANPTLTITYSGFIGTEGPAVIDIPPTVTTDALQNSNTGTYPISLSGGSDNNYVLSYTDGVLTINKADQTIVFNSLAPATYGDPDINLSATASSGLTTIYSSDNINVATIIGGMIHITGAGTTVITASQPGDGNYNPAPVVPGTLLVNKGNLTFTADNKTKMYQAGNPVLTYVISGFAPGETQQVLDVLPAIQTTALQNSPYGSYPITISGGSDNNYNYIFVPGTLSIARISQTITFSDVPGRLLVKDSYTLSASSTSGLTVLFESRDVQKATVTGDLLTGVSKGIVQIRAYRPEDQNYEAAEVFATVEIYSTHKDIMHLFTPNNDGFNDFWELPDLATWGKCDVKIYNRWGKLVFADANYNNLWDGTSNGSPLPEGAYYFVVKTANAGTVTGTVNIVR